MMAEKLSIRPYGKPYMVFGVIWGGLGAWIAFALIATHNPTLWPAFAVCVVMLLSFWGWIWAHSINLDESALTYEAVLPRSTTVKISEISKVDFQKIRIGNIRSRGLQAIVVHCSHEGDGRRKIAINPRLFADQDLELLLKSLKTLGVKVWDN